MTRQGRVEFAGRERERALLGDLLRAANTGTGQVVLLGGASGVGKTRLAADTADRAGQLGMRCYWGRATPDGSPPYWPVRQILRLAAESSPKPEPGLAAGLALIAPELGGAGIAGHAGAAQRFRVFDAVTEFLTAAAVPNGLLVVLEDLQWADRSSLRLFTQLAAGIGRSRLMVLATYRDTETHTSAPLRQALAGLVSERSVTRLRLTGEPETGSRDAVRARLDRLSPLCGQIVASAAVLGAVLDPAALAAATGYPPDAVRSAVEEAVAAGIVTESARFGHDLIRATARLDVPAAEQLELHRRMAEHLAGRVDATERVAEVALHWLAAGDAASAACWATRAATLAMERLAWEHAASLYGRAIAAAVDAGLADRTRCRLLLASARAQSLANDKADARRSLLAAADIARAIGDFEAIAEAALVMSDGTDFGWHRPETALCEEALAGLPEQDSALRARLLAQLAVTDPWRSSSVADDSVSASALAMAERVGDPRAIAEALRARHITRSGPNGATDRLVLGDRMLAVGEANSDDDAVLCGRLWRFDALAQCGDVDLAAAELDAIESVAERLRSPLARWQAARRKAAISLARGQFSAAAALGEQAVALARRAEHEGTLMPSLGFLLILSTQTGGGANEALAEVVESASPARTPALASLRAVAAMLLLATGRRAEGRRIYRTLPEPAAVPGFQLLPALTGMAELAAQFDDRTAAADVHRLLSPFADLFVCGGNGVVAILGSARLPLGIAAATTGRLDDAVQHLRRAVQSNETAGLPPLAAISRYQLARTLAKRKRPGDIAEAVALAESAGTLANQLGMAPLRHGCRELTGSLSGLVAGRLTTREQEIAVLVAQGLTSRQIAAATHITERTVDNHVQHILGKLGCTSRAQIAGWIAAGQPRREISTGPDWSPGKPQ